MPDPTDYKTAVMLDTETGEVAYYREQGNNVRDSRVKSAVQ